VVPAGAPSRDSQVTVASGGFVSTNGYILAFRRYFGETPGAYAKRTATRTAA
jgi:AraC-like DNA-binding protein